MTLDLNYTHFIEIQKRMTTIVDHLNNAKNQLADKPVDAFEATLYAESELLNLIRHLKLEQRQSDVLCDEFSKHVQRLQTIAYLHMGDDPQTVLKNEFAMCAKEKDVTQYINAQQQQRNARFIGPQLPNLLFYDLRQP